MRFLCPIILGLFAAANSQFNCPDTGNGYYADSKQCDKYYKCTKGVAEEELCQDGLLFNENAPWTRNPCDYPLDVDCGSRTLTQPPQATERCPRQWGVHFTGDRANCGTFKNCAAGIAYDFTCPEGLAFNEKSLRCDWPEEAPNCDPAAFLGFSCPAATPEELLQLAGGHTRYPHTRDCKKFFVCESGINVRLLSCEDGQVFNPAILDCSEPKEVPGCENYYGSSKK